VLDTVDSTNNFAKDYVKKKNNTSTTVIIANEQTKGKGTKGRQFYSPKGTGLYLSYIFHKEFSLNDLTPITPAAAVAVRRAIYSYYSIESSIKWVNDIELNDRKLCGILTETVGHNDKRSSIIIGIGINISTNSFPDDIKNKAVAISEYCHVGDINNFTSKIIRELEEVLNLDANDLINEYRNVCSTIGKQISFLSDNKLEIGKAIDIDKDGHLIVETNEGIVTLISGDISINNVEDIN